MMISIIFFQPSALTQVPVFKRAIGLGREIASEKYISKPFENYISKLIETEDLFMKKKT